MTLRRRLYLQFGLAILPLLLLLGYLGLARSDLPQRVSAALTTYDLALAANDGYKAFLGGVADAVDTGRVGSDALAALARAHASADKLATASPQARSVADRLGAISTRVSANPVVATVLPLRAEMQSLRTEVQKSLDDGRSAVTALVEEERRNAEMRERIALAGGVGALFVVVFMAVVLRRMVNGITEPIAASVAVAHAISEGRLDNRVDSQRRDEIGQLLAAVGTMQEHLARIVREVRSRAESVAEASETLSTETGALSRRTESQAASLEEAAASMEELSSAVRENSAAASRADALARDASTAAIAGAEAVQAVVDTMQQITGSSRRIGDIVGVIDSIAFQTNILALNAAVEAARAGEHGRGFAVVASEVRSLSQRCATAATEIKQLIAESVGDVEGGGRRVQEAGRSIEVLVAGVQEVGTLMTEIAGASRQQERGIEQVGSAVTEMDGVVQKNAAAAQQSASASERLRSDARALADAVSRFVLPDATLDRPRTPRLPRRG